jgi:diguanylate cyclase (GGDEF)-like protein/PAS domain S-box-containing protein
MTTVPSRPKSDFDTATAAVLDAQYASADRIVNGVRIGVIGVLGIVAALWSPYLTGDLNWVNVVVCTPMLVWAMAQHFLYHKPGRRWRPLSALNTYLDISAVTLLLLGYGLFGMPDLAVKSPMWTAYLIILAARPFTGSPRRAAAATVVAAVQYAAIASFFTLDARLPLLSSPLESVRASGTTLLDEGAKVLMIVVVGAVLTYATAWSERTLRRSVEAMRDSDARFRGVFEHSAVGIILLDATARVLHSNSAFDRFLGLRGRDLQGRPISDFTSAEDTESTARLAHEVAMGNRDDATIEVRFVRRQGRVAWGTLTISRAIDGHELRLIAMVQDTSERKALEAQLLHQAFHDPLTELANRALFRDRLEHALARTARESGRIAVLLLDLDDFKAINDTQGHAAGDRMLEVVATRLRGATRGCDTVARLGGDEFAVLLEQMHAGAGAEVVAARIIEALGYPVETATGRVTSLTASVGIAVLNPGEGAEELLRNADVAMYEAKNRDRGHWILYNPAMHATLVDRVSLQSDLRGALERQQLSLAYQPIVELDSGAITGVETLLRWDHPKRGSVPPTTFISVAEECGLMVPIGRWVLNAACRQGAAWNARRNGLPLTITVNLSGRQLLHESIVGDVRDALANSGLDPECLIVEITETVLMQETEVTLARLAEFKALGVRLAIDDFGTGYSSLSYLQQFPVDVLKIDQSFIEGLRRGSNDAALIKAIIALAGSLTLSTIAEGVEDLGQQRQLRKLGCHSAQGFLFSRPVSPAEIDDLLARGLRPTLLTASAERA